VLDFLEQDSALRADIVHGVTHCHVFARACICLGDINISAVPAGQNPSRRSNSKRV
jgi:hypothetical protein